MKKQHYISTLENLAFFLAMFVNLWIFLKKYQNLYCNDCQGLIMLDKNQDKQVTLRDYLTVKEAAAFLGVSASTLRNWDKGGKLKAIRHPINGYRLYECRDLEKVLNVLKKKS